MIADPRVRGVSVTGSERAGTAVAALAGAAPQEGRARARRLGRVHRARHRRPAARWSSDAVAARMENAGQACNAAKRFIVADPLYDDFVEQLTARPWPR